MGKFDIKYQNYDLVVKEAFSIFNNKNLSFLGIDLPEIECLLSTEFAEITAQESRVDMVFRLKDQTILHIECEVQLSKKDLLRFAAYDLRLYEKYNTRIHTIVFCIGKKKATMTTLDTGVMQYNVVINNLVEMDSELVLKKIKHQITVGEPVNPLELIFLPLMSKSRPIEEILLETINLDKMIQLDEVSQSKLVATSLVLLDKLIDREVLEKTWEDFTMYKVFEFVEEKGMQRGLEKGIQKGMEKGKADLLLKILASRFEQIPPQYSNRIYKLSVEQIEEMSINAFKIKSLEELEEYFQTK